MKGTPETARRQAFREATDWLILLQEEPDDRDLRRRFDAWREASPLNAEAWAATARTSDVAAAMTPAHADEWMPALARRNAQYRMTQRPTTQRLTPPWSRRRIGLSVAAAALAACIALVAAPPMILRLQADHLTGTAELRTLELPDGSKVTLGPASAVALAFTAGERRLRLLEGEAFFEVVRDPARPFRVEAAGVDASVLGTSFDVRLEARVVTVAVQEGVVGVASREESGLPAERLEAGQSVRVGPDRRVERSTEPAQLVAAWRRGQLLSHDRPLREAVDQLRRYYPGTIVLTDDALAERPVTGLYNLADPEEALRGIVQAHGGRVRRITPWLLVVSGS